MTSRKGPACRPPGVHAWSAELAVKARDLAAAERDLDAVSEEQQERNQRAVAAPQAAQRESRPVGASSLNEKSTIEVLMKAA